MKIEIAYLMPDDQILATVALGEGAQVADALAAVRDVAPFSDLDLDVLPVGVFGRVVARNRLLTDGDRVELYRPLEADPREARRRRT
ncbi:MAG: RnfH family protein [Pseudomonadales bacterium]|nr:RnfH family protein [Pseudomonadales bacterium]MDP6469619.1 RnfH family protein [Pseudomonadales bacterium]MDP6827460.1 RnfH family protein [Pseudomonadales bacterium]MDP6973195.1 RnfH family protein [Pseudomonadales bacterium]